MTAPADCRLIGRRRIVEADPWDRGHPGLVEPAMLIALASLEADLDLQYSCSVAQRTTSSAAC
jgi:hypothetical protein